MRFEIIFFQMISAATAEDDGHEVLKIKAEIQREENDENGDNTSVTEKDAETYRKKYEFFQRYNYVKIGVKSKL